MTRVGLPLFEADGVGGDNPRAYVDLDGRVVLPDGSEPTQREKRLDGFLELPRILFADVPTMLHLSCGISIVPLDER